MKNKYIRLYEEFREYNRDVQIQELPEFELSDKTIDDVLSDDFFDDVDEEEVENNKEVVSISGWEVY
jgi:hypothetical protein